MNVLTGERMKMVDEETIKRYCPGIELMERAGRQVAEFVQENYALQGFKAAIFVGPGNNGGDALVVARLLSEEGLACSLHYLAPMEKSAVDAAKIYQRIQDRLASYSNLKEINSTRPDWVSIIRKDCVDATLIVDGLFGTGLSRDLEGRAAEMVNQINLSGLPVVSIDTPSGIHSDTGEVLGVAVRATQTVTMGYPKVGLLFHPGKSYVGDLEVADLEFPDEVLEVNSLGIYLLDRAEARRRLPPRAPDAHKFDMGVVLVVAGSRAYTGAALLTAEAALRSGCGIVYVAVPEGIRPVIQSAMREAIVVPVPETQDGSIARGAVDTLQSYMDRADAIIAGPGLGRSQETLDFVRTLVAASPTTVVLDADAINAFAGNMDGLATLETPVIITPHSGEFGGVMDRSIPTDPMERIEVTRETAKNTKITIVHKGAPTLVASTAGEIWVNQHGHSALATAGTGDVLAGLVGGMRAQGASDLDAAAVSCFLHGRAAELAAEEWSVRGVLAGDLLMYIGGALLELEALAK